MSYPDVHGDVIAVADGAGARTAGPLHYDPYGLFIEFISISEYWHDVQNDCREAVAGILERGIKAK